MKLRVRNFFQSAVVDDEVDWEGMGIIKPNKDVQYNQVATPVTIETNDIVRFNQSSNGGYLVVEMRSGDFYMLDHQYDDLNSLLGAIDLDKYSDAIHQYMQQPVLLPKSTLTITRPTKNNG